MTKETYYRLMLAKSCQILEKTPDEVVALIVDCWHAWQDHQAFEWYYREDDTGYSPIDEYFNTFSVICIGVFKHEPGHLMKDESFVISTFQGIFSRLEWGKRMFGGEFVGIRPIPHEIIPSRYFIAYKSFSLKGAGKGYRARMKLKENLPRRLHFFIQQARSYNRTKIPDRNQWKRRIDHFIYKMNTSPKKAGALHELETFISIDDFWRCATGKVHPERVKEHFKMYQTEMF